VLDKDVACKRRVVMNRSIRMMTLLFSSLVVAGICHGKMEEGIGSAKAMRIRERLKDPLLRLLATSEFATHKELAQRYKDAKEVLESYGKEIEDVRGEGVTKPAPPVMKSPMQPPAPPATPSGPTGRSPMAQVPPRPIAIQPTPMTTEIGLEEDDEEDAEETEDPIAPPTPVRPPTPIAPPTPVRPPTPIAPPTPVRPPTPVGPPTGMPMAK